MEITSLDSRHFEVQAGILGRSQNVNNINVVIVVVVVLHVSRFVAKFSGQKNVGQTTEREKREEKQNINVVVS